jgi:SulP family sulfate permease
LIIFLIVVWFAWITAYIPMAALAGILMVTAFKMMEFDSFSKIGKVPVSDSLVMIVTMIVTVLEDLIVGVACGTILAVILIFIQMKTAKNADTKAETADDSIISMPNFLFFGNIKKLSDKLEAATESRIILDMQAVTVIDETAILFDKIVFSGGKIGYFIEVNPNELDKVIPIKFVDIVE